MAIFTAAPANARPVPFFTPQVSTGGYHFPLSKLFWISGCRIMQNTQSNRSLFSPWSHLNTGKGCMFVFPRASLIFDTPGGHLSEFGQNIISVFQPEAAVAAKLLPESVSEQSHSGSFLHHLSEIPTEVSVAGVALLVGTSIGYLISKNVQNEASGGSEPASEWLLVMNSTPFNRFVLMRCPSIKFKDMDAYEGLSKKLTAEGHHVGRVHNTSLGIGDEDANRDCDSTFSKKKVEWTGRVLQGAPYNENSSRGQVGKESNMEKHMPTYQRFFLHTKDGGVLAIDWPSHLDFSGEHGLDTTILLVPGSSDGSKDKGVQEFVQRCVRHGYFPMVLNPRGCGGSPLTTPRLFTAGDSDDVRMTVEFVLKSRPWATTMAVGWGYGADMLVKYLGEEAASTPLTAAVCIENTFDLEESNKISQDDHVNLFNRKMTSGFVEILKSNQMVFEGKGRCFDMQKGLSANTIRDFDEAISMVSRGYDNVHELYKDSSSKSWIDNVKIPIFCIQDNVSIEKTFAIPRHVFEENPFTTLILLLTRRGGPISQTNTSGHSSLVIEWLAAIELAFLKGRHPLLQGRDVTFKLPLKERSFKESSQDSGEVANQSTGLGRSNESSDDFLPSVNPDLGLSYRGHNTDQNAAQEDSKALVKTSQNSHGFDNEDTWRGELNGSEPENSDTDASDDDNSDVEQGQVKQAAESVLKVLDVTMPGTLSEKQKEEVLEAVGRGETLVSALQEACPEDVREKMGTAVSAAVQARGISLKLAGFGKNMPAPKIPDGMVEKIQQKLSSFVHDKSPIASLHDTASNTSCQNEEAQKLSQESLNTRQTESYASVLPGGQTENGAAAEPSCKAGSDAEQRVDQDRFPEKQRQEDVSLVTDKETRDMEADAVSQDRFPEKQRQDDVSLVTDKETRDMEADANKTNESDSMQAGDSFPQEQQTSHGLEQKQESSVTASQMNEPQSEKKNDTKINSNPNDHNKTIPEQNVGEALPPQTPSATPAASPLPSIDIGRAFEALTGVDDSTQMAVTNVFGVIENVLEQLEKEQGQKDEPLQQGQKDEQVEQGQRDKQLEQRQKDEHLEQSSSLIHERSMDGRDVDTEKHSPLQGELHGDMSGQLGLSEGTSRQECPGKGSDESKEELRKLQKVATRDFDKKTDGICFSNSSPSSQKSSSSEREEEFDDANLALEYFEEENVWKLSDGSSETNSNQDGMTEGIMDDNTTVENSKLNRVTSMEENRVINPEYIIVDDAVKHSQTRGIFCNGTVQVDDESSSESLNSTTRPCRHLDMLPPLQTKVQDLVMDALELELLRRLGNSDMRLLGNTLERDIEVVSLTVAETAGTELKAYHLDCADEEVLQKLLNETMDMEDKVHVDTIISAMNGIYGELDVLPSVLPAGVLFGIVLAALSPLGIISTHDVQDSKKLLQTQREGFSSRNSSSLVQTSQKFKFLEKKYGRDGITSSRQLLHENFKSNETSDKEEDMNRGSCNKDVKLLSGAETCDRIPASAEKATSTCNIIGVMTAAASATAALAGQEIFCSTEQVNEEAGSQVLTNDVVRNVSESDDEQSDKDENKPSIVSTLAEKAMSVAAPVVPTKQDGGVDHERLVGILAGLGQKGGILRFVGKVALLWGGLRGAMSLTDRLLVFLRISDRPLYQRISGFMVMVLLLWSPVLVPLLPSLLQQWASQSQNGIASTAALIGLYCAVVILINIWGRKIRGYENPLHQYGVNIQPGSNARQLQSLLSGLVLGLSLLASIYLLGTALHLIQFDWASALFLNTSKNFLWNIFCGWRIFKLMGQCFGISLAVSFVEELFFRSWLQREISTELGFHKATLISGLAFSITHRSLPLMPGLWFLSCILTGAKVRCNGDLNLAIGIHAGLMAGTQLINMYGQVKYGANASGWFVGHQSADPFTGLIGVSILGGLALLFYPWGYNEKERN